MAQLTTPPAPEIVPGSSDLVLVGLAPNVATEGRPELWLRADGSKLRHSANRLRDLCGLSTADYNRIFGRTNLLDYCPTRPSMGRRSSDRWSRVEASRRASELTPLLRGKRVLLLGRAVQFAFLRQVLPWVEWRPAWYTGNPGVAFEVATIPHPSGRCRLYNPGEEVGERVRTWLRDLVRPLLV